MKSTPSWPPVSDCSACCLPVVCLSLIFACLSLAVFGWLQPHARYAYRALLFTATHVEVFYLAEEGVFMQAGNRTFILDKLSRSDGSFGKIFLSMIAATRVRKPSLLHAGG